VEKLQRAVIQGLSEDLRPRSSSEYYYKMHRDHEGFEEAVKVKSLSAEGGEGKQPDTEGSHIARPPSTE
jgi:hypothetical protein